ncbi:electron transfer flavoprotein subunit alpha/FixB family protein [Ilyomonas limi]|uniref:Electron transfer flavoprotein subunit alpha/FixB family protein n=1 Tax=Ilyomonas limi TaxID=2575867 RepID=A0A4U3L6V9_9BACT|nr:electron transfer flavoprotein subunit alpha/FixB family protein [Ilyomonas limi]TKK70770.1 electron transfer flavoprotein subunit alpha/FixB family protein [Ilyomonas limi]
MSVLIFVDQAEGQIRKASLEALSYGVALAKQIGTTANAVVLGNLAKNAADLGSYGVSKVYHGESDTFNTMDAQAYTNAIMEAVQKSNAEVIVFSHNQTGRAVAPRIAAKLKAGLVAGAVALPDTSNGFAVRKSVFSGKAFANVAITSPVKVITVNPNSFRIAETGSETAQVEKLDATADNAKVKAATVNKVQGEVPLTEAEIVVSGGRGMKGPENWGILEDLAHSLHAALACSRPVADAHWRPHHEHVGQTGIQVSPNLYIAVGISGAIQHLAGVNRSKVMVVINKDAEAPFFKAADYGVVGDLFEIVPKLTEEIKKLKGV